MDMKRILQAMDGVATQPVVGADSMAKFLSIVDKNANVQILQEGSPHKVTLPVQMAMQHYQQPEVQQKVIERKSSLLNKFFTEVEQEFAEEQTQKRQLINQYASVIAERVMMKESKQLDEKSTSEKQARFMAAAAHDPKFAKKVGMKQSVAKEFNKADTGTKQLSNAMKHKKNVKENEIPGHSMGFTGGVGPGLQSNAPMEDAASTMHPTRRYRMMRRISKKAGIDLSHLELASDDELHHLYKQHGLAEMAVNFNKDSPLDSEIINHKGVNPASIRTRMARAGRQLTELAEMAKSDDPRIWQHLANLFPELEMNIEQVRHGIEQLAEIKSKGGRRSVNIPSGLRENELPKPPQKVKTIKAKKKTSVCKTGQVQTGMQPKDGRMVPKCSVR
jgi:hypothetical protein